MKKKLIAGMLASVLAFGALSAANSPAAESDVRTDDAITLKVITSKETAEDEAALKKLTAKAKKQGADVPEDIYGPFYGWEKGKLVEINWRYSSIKISGAWNFSGLKNLKELSCGYKDNLSKLDVSGCKNLEDLSCYNNNLSKLDVSKCTKLDLWLRDEGVTVIRG